MVNKIVAGIGQGLKDISSEFIQEGQKQAKEAGREVISSVTGMEIKDSGQSPAELEQLKKIGEQKEKEKGQQIPELRRILEQQQNSQAFLDRDKQMKQQMSGQEAQKMVAARQKKMGSSMNPLDAVGQKLTGMKALMFKNKKETKQQ